MCTSGIKNIPTKDIEKMVKLLLESQHKRLEIMEKNRRSNVKFGMFMKSKTRYGEKFIYNFPDDVRKLSRYITSTSKELVDILKNKVVNMDKKAFIFSYVDVGIRVQGYEVNHDVNYLVNAMVYGVSLTQDWQFWLMTPYGMSMLYNMTNDRRHFIDFIGMLQSASINGVSETDILKRLPKMGFNICDPKRYEVLSSLIIGNGINKVARMGQAAILKMIEKNIASNF